MKFFLNGREKEYNGDLERSLLTYLRNDLDIKTPKNGCFGEGTCGACSIILDGKARTSCNLKMRNVAKKHVITHQGLEEAIQEAFSWSFILKGGIQCGYCTPGVVMSAYSLLRKNLSPSRDEIKKAINRNLCRCTGYVKIIDSIMYAASILRGEVRLDEVKNMLLKGKVGQFYPKHNAFDAVLGKRKFVSDMEGPSMCFASLKFSDHPRALIEKINIEKALNVNGVIKIFLAKDVPGERNIGVILHDWPLMIGENEETRYVGDVLAQVVAIDEKAAQEAVELIEVTYQILEPIVDVEKALDSKDYKIHKEGNILSDFEIKRGDIDQAFNNSTFISEGTYHSQRIEHAFLETESALALYQEKNGRRGIKIFSQSQGVYEDRKQISRLLGLPLDDVQVVQVETGGAFGGKEDLSVQGHVALASWLLKLPVKLTLNRNESMRMHPKRHPVKMHYKVGCDKEGLLTVLKARILCDTGAYASVGMKVMSRAGVHATGAYYFPVVDIESKAIYTNNLPCGAMRGFGVNQSTFAIESCIDDLCQQGEFDRFDFRYKNALAAGKALATGEILGEAVGVRQTLMALRDQFRKAKYAGLACGIKNCGVGGGVPDVGNVKIVIQDKDKIIIHHGWSEMGQGIHTMAIQLLCQETDLDPGKIEVIVDTAEDVVCGMTTSSRGTSLIGLSIIEAAKAFKKDLDKVGIEALVGQTYRGHWECDFTSKPSSDVPSNKIKTHYSYSYATQLVILDQKGNIEEVIVAQDAGKIINPILFEGQIEGAVHMGLGHALTEDFPMDNCKPLVKKLVECGVLRCREMPKIQVIGLEIKDPLGPFGAKGIGEVGLVPTAAAVANAFSLYNKKRVFRLPIKGRFKDHKYSMKI